MSEPSWEQIEALFLEAAALPPEARGEFVARHTARTPELRDRLLRLLEAHRRQADSFEGLIRSGAREITRELALTAVGRRVGAYRLISVLGQGGTSTVYLAERDDAQYDARVAVKLLHPGMVSDAMRDRIRVERQILARLEHPNIARLYDGGTTEEGLPYFVMEYVDGVPLLAACAENRWPPERRLTLFLELCSAIEYAHQQLVVHRDIKPRNLLVTRDGTPKLLDFGIATTDAEPCGSGAVRMLTPAYASPEQLRGEPVTAVSDVYSLGVVLSEILTGARPHRIESQMTAEDAANLITVGAGLLPSAQPGLSSSLARFLRGDLDSIVARATDPDPGRRYRSVAELGEDVRRFLGGEAVLAREGGALYRVSRFVGRHRLALAAATLVVALGIASVVTILDQARQAREERDSAEQIAASLVGLFDVVEQGGAELTIRELLDHGIGQVRDLDGQPGNQARLLRTLAELYERIGDLDASRAAFEEVLRIHRDRTGDEAGLAAAYHDLGRSHALQGDFARARELFERGLAGRTRVLGPRHAFVATSLNALALVNQEMGNFDLAESYYRRSIEVNLAQGPDNGYTQVVQTNFALLLYDLGRFEEAERQYRAVLAVGRQPHDDYERDELAELHDGLGLTLEALGRTQEAIAAHERALAMRVAIYGERHYLVARSKEHLGGAHLSAGELARAEALILEALAERASTLGTTHVEYGDSLLALGRLYRRQGRDAEARERLAGAFDVYRASDAAHPRIAEALIETAELQAAGGERAAACATLARARTLLESGDHRRSRVERLAGSCPVR